jgi:hypothetical protein
MVIHLGEAANAEARNKVRLTLRLGVELGAGRRDRLSGGMRRGTAFTVGTTMRTTAARRRCRIHP